MPAAYDAIARATAAGLRVVAVTGRPAGWAEVFACTWPLAGAIAENGAFAVRRASDGRSVERMTWDDADTCHAQGAKLRALSDAIVRDIPAARLADDQWLRRCDVAFDIGETQQLPRPHHRRHLRAHPRRRRPLHHVVGARPRVLRRPRQGRHVRPRRARLVGRRPRRHP